MEGREERLGGQEGNAARDCGELVQIRVLEMQRGGWHSRGAVTGRGEQEGRNQRCRLPTRTFQTGGALTAREHERVVWVG